MRLDRFVVIRITELTPAAGTLVSKEHPLCFFLEWHASGTLQAA